MEINKAMCPARAAAARIRLLCCLGLESHAIMPSLLKELRRLVASRTSAFIWGDQRRRIENYLSEGMDQADSRCAVYRSEFRNRRGHAAISELLTSLRARRGVACQSERVSVERRAYCRHGYHAAHSSGHDHMLRIVVDHGGRALGAMSLLRAANDPCFEARDVTRLAAIKPYLARALTVPRTALEVPLVDSEDQGLAIVDVRGRILHMSREARGLLFLATHPVVCSERLARSPVDLALPQEVAQLCRGLVEAMTDNTGETASPVWRCLNPWGGFVFRAYRLNNYMAASVRLIGIAIRRQEPLPLKILRHMEQLPLSGRQMQVCLLLAAGHSRRTIAARLGVSQHTAITYIRQVYGKLQVHTRGELWNECCCCEVSLSRAYRQSSRRAHLCGRCAA